MKGIPFWIRRAILQKRSDASRKFFGSKMNDRKGNPLFYTDEELKFRATLSSKDGVLALKFLQLQKRLNLLEKSQ